MTPAPPWYALTQTVLCLSAGWAILSLYARGTPVRPDEPAETPVRDPGLLWLGLAVSIWGVVGAVLLLPLDSATAHALRPLLSCANSGCLLISASHLDYGPQFLQRARDWPHWRQGALLGSLGVAVLTVALELWLGPTPAARVPDFALSVATLSLYGLGLFRSFHRRGFPSLAVLATLAILAQLVAQLPEVSDLLAAVGVADDLRWSLNLGSKGMVLVVFLSLAMSWVHEVGRRPSRTAAALVFTGQQRVGPNNRRRWIVESAGGDIEMRETPHRDLLALALHRVRERDRADGGWVSSPDLVGGLDDSRIRRVREDLRPAGLDGLVESNFQKCYRLGIPADHIAIDPALLAERRA